MVVLIRPKRDSDTIHEVPGPYMPLPNAEAHLNAIRVAIGNNAVVLPWLAIGPNELIGAYLAA